MGRHPFDHAVVGRLQLYLESLLRIILKTDATLRYYTSQSHTPRAETYLLAG